MTAFHLKYRPNRLERLIGHDAVVQRLQGMISEQKVPNALLFVGPSSAGKTTLSRAVAAAINKVKNVAALGPDYKEINGTDQRTIEDIRGLIQLSKFKPRHAKRVIVIDEFQGVLSNPQAAQALLKPLEEPSPDTLWILCTMDPSKLGTGVGRAIANRCTQFVLEPHTEEDLRKQCVRIIKAEQMLYAKKLIPTLVQSCNGEMRTLANLLQAVQQYYDGLGKKPKLLSEEHVSQIVQSTSQSDEELAVKVMLAVYQRQFADVQRHLLDVQDGYRFVSLLLQANLFLLNQAALKGQRHPKLAWWSKTNKELAAKTKSLKLTLGTLAKVNRDLVHAKIQAANHALPAEELLSAVLYQTIVEM